MQLWYPKVICLSDFYRMLSMCSSPHTSADPSQYFKQFLLAISALPVFFPWPSISSYFCHSFLMQQSTVRAEGAREAISSF